MRCKSCDEFVGQMLEHVDFYVKRGILLHEHMSFSFHYRQVTSSLQFHTKYTRVFHKTRCYNQRKWISLKAKSIFTAYPYRLYSLLR